MNRRAHDECFMNSGAFEDYLGKPEMSLKKTGRFFHVFCGKSGKTATKCHGYINVLPFFLGGNWAKMAQGNMWFKNEVFRRPRKALSWEMASRKTHRSWQDFPLGKNLGKFARGKKDIFPENPRFYVKPPNEFPYLGYVEGDFFTF